MRDYEAYEYFCLYTRNLMHIPARATWLRRNCRAPQVEVMGRWQTSMTHSDTCIGCILIGIFNKHVGNYISYT